MRGGEGRKRKSEEREVPYNADGSDRIKRGEEVLYV